MNKEKDGQWKDLIEANIVLKPNEWNKNENYLTKWQHPRQSRLECKRLPQGSQNVQELSYQIRRK